MTEGRDHLREVLQALVLAAAEDEARLVTAEVQRRIGEGGTVRQWLQMIFVVISERNPEAAELFWAGASRA